MFKFSNSQMISISISFLIVACITIILFFLLRNKNIKIRKIPQKIVTIFVIISEIIKYFLMILQGNYYSLYPTYYCSYIWFWFLCADFFKGKFADSCEAISLCGSFCVFCVIFNKSI